MRERDAASRSEVQRRLQQAVPDDRVVPFLMQNLVARNDHFDWRLNLLGISLAMPQLCAFPTSLLGLCFDGPVAVIAGTNSEYVAQSGPDSFQPMFSQAEVEFIDNAGHWVHADQPAAFVASVRRVLQGDMQSSIAEQAL